MSKVFTNKEVKEGLLTGLTAEARVASLRSLLELPSRLDHWSLSSDHNLRIVFFNCYSALDWTACYLSDDPNAMFTALTTTQLSPAVTNVLDATVLDELFQEITALQGRTLKVLLGGVAGTMKPNQLWNTIKHSGVVGITTTLSMSLGQCYAIGNMLIQIESMEQFYGSVYAFIGRVMKEVLPHL
jgi:hypothetical protein